MIVVKTYGNVLLFTENKFRELFCSILILSLEKPRNYLFLLLRTNQKNTQKHKRKNDHLDMTLCHVYMQ